MEQNKLHVTIDLDLDAETTQKSSTILERILDWVRIREEAAVNGFAIRVEAPTVRAAEDCFHLPAGFYALKQEITSPVETQTRNAYKIERQGNPFFYVHGAEDLLMLINSLLHHTQQKPSIPNPEPFWTELLADTEATLLRACCLFLWTECSVEDRCLCSLLKMLQSGCESADDESAPPLSDHCILNYLFEAVAERSPNHCCVNAFTLAKSLAGIAVAREALLSCIYRIEHMTLGQLNLIVNELVDNFSKQSSKL